MGSGRLRLLALLCALAALGLALIGPATASAWIEVRQVSQDENGDSVEGPILAVFHNAYRCKAGRKGALLKYLVSARSSDGQSQLNVYWHQFSGFHEYALDYGGDADPWFSFNGPAGNYTNLNTPPDVPPFGGGIAWSPNGRKMGLGFEPTFNTDISAAVQLVGGFKCPPKKKKHHRLR